MEIVNIREYGSRHPQTTKTILLPEVKFGFLLKCSGGGFYIDSIVTVVSCHASPNKAQLTSSRRENQRGVSAPEGSKNPFERV